MADATSAVATYYKHTFPADDVFRFATIHARDPSDVEVVVTFEGVGCGGGEIWKRFNACARAADLRALALGKTNPTLHMGAAYTEAANRARAPGVVPVGKPLLFDLDVQDLAWLKVDKNDVAANDRAVRLLFGAAHVLKVCLQEMFGFEHFLPIYSGRRGVHLWVLDQRAWSLSTEARRAICAALAAPGDGTDDDLGRFGGLARWPSVSEACWAAQQRVEDEVLFAPRSAGGFGLLDSTAEVDAFVARLFDVKQDATYAERTTQLRGKTLRAVGCTKGLEARAKLVEALEHDVFFQHRLEQIVRTLTWPRLDEGASASLTHCAKLPFSLKAATGRISLPLTHLLPDPTSPRALPPLVTCDRLATDERAAVRVFDLARETLCAAVRAARGDSPVPAKRRATGDIEDLVAASPDPPRGKSPRGAPDADSCSDYGDDWVIREH
jgi:DNA primase small subunit